MAKNKQQQSHRNQALRAAAAEEKSAAQEQAQPKRGTRSTVPEVAPFPKGWEKPGSKTIPQTSAQKSQGKEVVSSFHANTPPGLHKQSTSSLSKPKHNDSTTPKRKYVTSEKQRNRMEQITDTCNKTDIMETICHTQDALMCKGAQIVAHVGTHLFPNDPMQRLNFCKTTGAARNQISKVRGDFRKIGILFIFLHLFHLSCTFVHFYHLFCIYL